MLEILGTPVGRNAPDRQLWGGKELDGLRSPLLPRTNTPRGVLERALRQQSSLTDITESTLEGGADVNEGAQSQLVIMDEQGAAGGAVEQETRPPAGQEMTPDQIETLRRQVAVYCGICENLMTLHRAKMGGSASEAAPLQGADAFYQDSAAITSKGIKHRWAPTEAQKATLDRVFKELGGGTPSKARIKDLAKELSRHGPVTENNVYNWFQNKKARSKRKVAATEAESGVDRRTNKKAKEDGAHSSGSLNMSSFDIDRLSEGGAVSSGFGQRTTPTPPLQTPLTWRTNALTPELPPAHRPPIFSDPALQDAAAMLLYAAADNASQGGGAQSLANTLGLLGAGGENAAAFFQGGNGSLDRSLGAGIELPYGGLTADGAYGQPQAEPSLKVLINGRPYDVPAGPLDVRASFGEGMALYDSRGAAVVMDNTGVTFDALHDGESYYLHNELQSGLGLAHDRLGRALFS